MNPATLNRLSPIVLLFSMSLLFVAESAVGQRSKNLYLKDLQAFFKEVEANAPFFKLKGIEKSFAKRKKELLKQAKRCRSDKDFMPIALEAVKQLRDGHASFRDVRPKMDSSSGIMWPGVTMLRGAEDSVIVGASPRALAKKLPPGAQVLKIDGKPARKYLDQRGAEAWKKGGFFSSPQRARFFAYRYALEGERGTQHKLQVLVGKQRRSVKVRCDQKFSGWLHLYNPPKDMEQAAKSTWHCMLDGGVGYIYLRRMDSSAEDGVVKAIEAHDNAKAWIVDLRGNTGGGYSRSFKSTIKGLGQRVAVIMDAGAISAAETFARDLIEICRARGFGTVTAGSSSVKKVWKFPSGVASVRYSTASRRGLKGKPIEFNGVTPHEEVLPDPADVAAGLNTEIKVATKWLLKR